MGQTSLALGFTVLVWWLSTGVIIALCNRGSKAFVPVFAASCALLPFLLMGLARCATAASAGCAYGGFLCAVLAWGWLEMGFLMGFITGPRALPCPAGAQGWPRFRMALGALLYHEMSILLMAVLVVAITWRAPNQTGTLAFLILTLMRISAKLNIFLGVPNLTDEFLPARLGYLKTYFRRAPASALFPVSLLAGAAAAAALIHRAVTAQGDAHAGSLLLLTLTLLGIAEHLFMITRLPDAALWRWAVSRTTAAMTGGGTPVSRPTACKSES